MTDEAALPTTCPNCGDDLAKNYCPNCGQERTGTIVPVRHLLHDVAEEFFLLDSKLFRTLKPLLTRPGFLTNEYIAGRRVRYLSPFRLYFVISALYFLAFSFAHYDVEVMHGLAYGLEQAHHAHLRSAPGHEAMATMQIAGNMHAMHMLPGPSLVTDRERRHRVAVARTSMWFLMNQSKITFLLVPLAALLLKLLYFTTRRLYIEHLVFAVHVQSFLFAVLLPTLLPFGRSFTYLLAFTGSAVYLYIAMRRVYRQCAVSTAVRCGVMLASYLVIMAGAAYGAFLVFYARA